MVTAGEAFKLPDTGQTQCYDGSGTPLTCLSPEQPLAQDGSYTINPFSYTDNNTGLMWQKEDNNSKYNWYKANGIYDATSNPSFQKVCGALGLGGYADWRLPTN